MLPPPEISQTARQKKIKLKAIKHQMKKAMILHSQALSNNDIQEDKHQTASPPLKNAPTIVHLTTVTKQSTTTLQQSQPKMRSTNNLLNISSYHNPNQDLAASFKASLESPRTPEKNHMPPALGAE